MTTLPNGPVRCPAVEGFPPGMDRAGSRPADVAWPLAAPLELGALPGAAGCAALHAKAVAVEWGLARLCVAAGYVAADLVTRAVAASRKLPGVPPVGLWPRSDGTRILIAVWDACPEPPAWPTLRDWPFSAISEERGWHAYRGGRTCWSVLSWRDARVADGASMSTAVAGTVPVAAKADGHGIAAGSQPQNPGRLPARQRPARVFQGGRNAFAATGAAPRGLG